MVKLKIFSALVFATAIFHTASAQNGIHLQSIVRDKAFDILPNKDVSFRVSAIEKQEFGSPVYVETQKVTTNDFGLASFYFGHGTSLMGHFDSIKWSQNKYFLKIEVDIDGGSNFKINAIQEIGSVPLALHSQTADRLTSQSGAEIDPIFSKSVASKIDSAEIDYWGKKQNPLVAGVGINISNDTISLKTRQDLIIGDFYLGGIVFYLYRDSSNQQHGKVLSLKRDASGVKWGTVSQTIPKCNDLFDGKSNCTYALQFYSGDYVDAIKYSMNSSLNGYKDWYMPSVFELKMITDNVYPIHQGLLRNQGDGFTNAEKIWTSTEYNSTYAYSVSILQSEVIIESKSTTKDLVVRSIRDF